MSNYTKTTNFGAKDTLPSGDSQKIIRGTEFDTEFNNVATAIATKLEVDGSNNLAISGTFSSTKLIPTGGTATGNGMYLPAANAVAISTNGTERLRIDSSGVASFASNPILNGGTANGLVYLDGSKVATSGSAVTFDGTNLATTGTASATKLIPTGGTATGNGMYLPAANTLALSTNGTERVRVDSSGNLGVGRTPSGSAIVDVQNDANAIIRVRGGAGSNEGSAFYGVSGSDTTRFAFGQVSRILGGTPNDDAVVYAAGYLAFAAAGSESARIASSGNLGIGTTSPGSRLDVQSASSANAYRVANIYNSAATGTTAGSNVLLRVASNGSGADSTLVLTDSTSTNGFISNNNGNLLFGNGLGFTERMRLDSSGNLGLGVTPSAWNSGGNFQLASGKNISAGNGIGLYANGYFDGAWKYINSVGAAGYVQSANEHIWYTAPSGTAGNTITFYSALTLSGSDTSSLLTMGRGFLTQGTGYAGAGSSTADPYIFYTNNTERARITSGGNFGVGTASPGAKLDIGGTNNTVFFKNSGATTGYALAAVSNTGGAFQYGISSSTGTFWGSGNAGNYSANIGTTTATNLGFGTNDTLRMLLDSSGNLGVGTASPSVKLDIRGIAHFFSGSSGTFNHINIGRTGSEARIGVAAATNDFLTGVTAGDSVFYSVSTGNSWYGTASSGAAIFSTNNTERARITSGGDFLVGTTTLAGAAGISFQTGGTTGLALINNNNAAATGYVFSSFRRSGVEIGSITQNGTTAVLFNTTSDRRLKENIVSAPSASDVIDAIEIVSHDWKAAPDEHVTYGVIAQDLALVAPQAVLQGDNSDEIEKVWGVDYSKLVPILIKELQSLRARVATLENN